MAKKSTLPKAAKQQIRDTLDGVRGCDRWMVAVWRQDADGVLRLWRVTERFDLSQQSRERALDLLEQDLAEEADRDPTA